MFSAACDQAICFLSLELSLERCLEGWCTGAQTVVCLGILLHLQDSSFRIARHADRCQGFARISPPPLRRQDSASVCFWERVAKPRPLKAFNGKLRHRGWQSLDRACALSPGSTCQRRRQCPPARHHPTQARCRYGSLCLCVQSKATRLRVASSSRRSCAPLNGY